MKSQQSIPQVVEKEEIVNTLLESIKSKENIGINIDNINKEISELLDLYHKLTNLQCIFKDFVGVVDDENKEFIGELLRKLKGDITNLNDEKLIEPSKEVISNITTALRKYDEFFELLKETNKRLETDLNEEEYRKLNTELTDAINRISEYKLADSISGIIDLKWTDISIDKDLEKDYKGIPEPVTNQKLTEIAREKLDILTPVLLWDDELTTQAITNFTESVGIYQDLMRLQFIFQYLINNNGKNTKYIEELFNMLNTGSGINLDDEKSIGKLLTSLQGDITSAIAGYNKLFKDLKEQVEKLNNQDENKQNVISALGEIIEYSLPDSLLAVIEDNDFKKNSYSLLENLVVSCEKMVETGTAAVKGTSISSSSNSSSVGPPEHMTIANQQYRSFAEAIIKANIELPDLMLGSNKHSIDYATTVLKEFFEDLNGIRRSDAETIKNQMKEWLNNLAKSPNEFLVRKISFILNFPGFGLAADERDNFMKPHVDNVFNGDIQKKISEAISSYDHDKIEPSALIHIINGIIKEQIGIVVDNFYEQAKKDITVTTVNLYMTHFKDHFCKDLTIRCTQKINKDYLKDKDIQLPYSELEKLNAICLDGPPGTGKTDGVAYIAEKFGFGFVSIDLPNQDDHFSLYGSSDSMQGGGHVGIILQAIANSKNSAVIVLLDELSRGKRDTIEQLGAATEQKSGVRINDKFLGIDCMPVKGVAYVGTSNDYYLLPPHMKSRFKKVTIPPLNTKQKEDILLSFIDRIDSNMREIFARKIENASDYSSYVNYLVNYYSYDVGGVRELMECVTRLMNIIKQNDLSNFYSVENGAIKFNVEKATDKINIEYIDAILNDAGFNKIDATQQKIKQLYEKIIDEKKQLKKINKNSDEYKKALLNIVFNSQQCIVLITDAKEQELYDDEYKAYLLGIGRHANEILTKYRYEGQYKLKPKTYNNTDGPNTYAVNEDRLARIISKQSLIQSKIALLDIKIAEAGTHSVQQQYDKEKNKLLKQANALEAKRLIVNKMLENGKLENNWERHLSEYLKFLQEQQQMLMDLDFTSTTSDHDLDYTVKTGENDNDTELHRIKADNKKNREILQKRIKNINNLIKQAEEYNQSRQQQTKKNKHIDRKKSEKNPLGSKPPAAERQSAPEGGASASEKVQSAPEGGASASEKVQSAPEGGASASEKVQSAPEGGASASEKVQSAPEGEASASEKVQSAPEGGASASEKVQSAPEGGASASEKVQSAPEGGASASEKVQSAPEGGASASEKVQSAPEGGASASEKVQSAPEGGASASAKVQSAPEGGASASAKVQSAPEGGASASELGKVLGPLVTKELAGPTLSPPTLEIKRKPSVTSVHLDTISPKAHTGVLSSFSTMHPPVLSSFPITHSPSLDSTAHEDLSHSSHEMSIGGTGNVGEKVSSGENIDVLKEKLKQKLLNNDYLKHLEYKLTRTRQRNDLKKANNRQFGGLDNKITNFNDKYKNFNDKYKKGIHIALERNRKGKNIENLMTEYLLYRDYSSEVILPSNEVKISKSGKYSYKIERIDDALKMTSDINNLSDEMIVQMVEAQMNAGNKLITVNNLYNYSININEINQPGFMESNPGKRLVKSLNIAKKLAEAAAAAGLKIEFTGSIKKIIDNEEFGGIFSNPYNHRSHDTLNL